MSIEYKFTWIDNTNVEGNKFENLELKCNDISIKIYLNENLTGFPDYFTEKCKNIRLYANENITLGNLILSKYDVSTLKTAWKNVEIEDMKSNITQLYKIVASDIFNEANEYYLVNINDNDNEANKFKNLALFRHSLRKYLVMAYISIVISERITCKYDGVSGNKQKHIKSLKELLYESTKLLLNIDAVPINTYRNWTDDEEDDGLKQNSEKVEISDKGNNINAGNPKLTFGTFPTEEMFKMMHNKK